MEHFQLNYNCRRYYYSPLVLFGIFNFNSSTQKTNAVVTESYQSKIILPKQNLVILVYDPMLSPTPAAHLVDENDKIIQTITLQNTPQCIDLAAKAGQVLTDFYCPDKDIEISNLEGEVREVKIVPVISPLVPSNMFVLDIHIQHFFPNIQLQNTPEMIQSKLGSAANIYYMRKIIMAQGNQNTDSKNVVLYEEGDQEGFEFAERIIIPNTNRATYIVVDDIYTQINKNIPSLWNLFNNNWGIAILVFQILILRMIRLITQE